MPRKTCQAIGKTSPQYAANLDEIFLIKILPLAIELACIFANKLRPLQVGPGSGPWEWALGVGPGSGHREWALGVGVRSGPWEWALGVGLKVQH